MSRLGGIDRALGAISWVAAGALVVMLFVGPVVVAEDEPAGAPAAQEGSDAGRYDAAAGSAGDGEELFAENCGSCHTLSAADTTGSIGPSLDGAELDSAEVAAIVSDGRGGMPAFSGDLDQTQIEAVAQFVADSSG